MSFFRLIYRYFRRDLGKHNRDVIAYCEKELNQSAPETNSLVQILFDKNIKWAYLDAEKILMKNTSQFVVLIPCFPN